jgi:CheY-like chemotaxis protein
LFIIIFLNPAIIANAMPENDTNVDDKVKRVLLLEDSDILGPIIKRHIVMLGYNVDLATCIAEAKEYEQRAHDTAKDYFAAILDMGVPLEKGTPVMKYAGWDYALKFRQRNPEIKMALHTLTKLYSKQIEELRQKGITYIDKARSDEGLAEFL